MARVTVEDCVERIPNRFDLVMVAAQRSRDVSAGAQITVERDNDKNPVVALREIADETIDVEQVKEALIRGLQKVVDIDEPEEEDQMELMAGANMAEGAEQEPAGTIAPVRPGDAEGVSMPTFEDVAPEDIANE